MNAKGFRGSVAGIPVKGGVVSIDSADAATIINAASGLIRTTADVVSSGVHAVGNGLKFGAKAGLAIGLLALLINDLTIKKSTKIPILSLAQIKTDQRDFLGICMTDIIECICENEKLNIPTCAINSIEASFRGFFKGENPKTFDGYDIEMIDGSSYSDCKPITNQLSFLTICGKQKTILFRKEIGGFWGRSIWSPRRPEYSEVSMSIEGVTTNDLADLRQRLFFAFENNLEKVIETIGKEQFEKYFIMKG